MKVVLVCGLADSPAVTEPQDVEAELDEDVVEDGEVGSAAGDTLAVYHADELWIRSRQQQRTQQHYQ